MMCVATMLQHVWLNIKVYILETSKFFRTTKRHVVYWDWAFLQALYAYLIITNKG